MDVAALGGGVELQALRGDCGRGHEEEETRRRRQGGTADGSDGTGGGGAASLSGLDSVTSAVPLLHHWALPSAVGLCV